MSGDPIERRRTAATTRRAVDAVAAVMLAGGAVLGVARLVAVAGVPAGLGWVVALAAVGYTGVGLWLAAGDPADLADVPVLGAGVTGFALVVSLLVTSWELGALLIVGLAALGLLSLRLAEVAGEVRSVGDDTDLAAPARPDPLRPVPREEAA